jgi:hypothetical protein
LIISQAKKWLCNNNFYSEKADDTNWKCYHHSIQSEGAVGVLTEEINCLRASLLADLDSISSNS